MKVTESKLDGCCLIQPDIYSDERGFFLESYNIKKYIDIIGEDTTFVQDNHSKSSQGVLRGLHFQKKNPQGKLVRVVQGEVYDVVVDIRKNSKTFGQHESFILSSEKDKGFSQKTCFLFSMHLCTNSIWVGVGDEIMTPSISLSKIISSGFLSTLTPLKL